MGFKEAVKEFQETQADPSLGLGIKDMARAAGKGALPLTGAAIGEGLGGPLGAIGGGVLGEGANQLLGITEPSLPQLAHEGVGMTAMKGLGAVGRGLKKFGTEARGAETLNRLAVPEIEKLLQTYQPPVPSKLLFERLAQSKANIPAPETRKAAKEEIGNINKSLPGFKESYGGLSKQMEGISQATKKTGFLPIDQYQRLLHDVGTHIEAANRAGGVEKHGYGGVYKALMQDLENAPSVMKSGDAKTLIDARQSFKREKVIDEISRLAEPFLKAGTSVEQFRANKLINRLNKPDDHLANMFRSSFSPEEQTVILNRLKTLNKIPAVPPGAGQSFGSGRFWTQTMPAIAGGGGVGYAAGGGLGAGIGMAVGAALPPAARMSRDLSIAWNTDTGRALIKGLLQQSDGKLTPQFWSAIEAFAANQGAEPGAELYKFTH